MILDVFLCDFFIESAQIFAVVHAACKLNPPVIPSMSIHSPAKNNVGSPFKENVFESTHPHFNPPHVVNSPLCEDFPTASILSFLSVFFSVASSPFEKFDHTLPCTPAFAHKYSHSPRGMSNSGVLPANFFGLFLRADKIADLKDSSPTGAIQFTVIGNLYAHSAKARAPKADNFRIAGPPKPKHCQEQRSAR